MNKDETSVNSYGSTEPSSKATKSSQAPINSIEHSSKGEYTSTNRPKSGGHGQEALGYMDEHGIPYEINVEYNNGVRQGNLPTSKEAMKQHGNRQSWFPKDWSRNDIQKAGEKIAKSLGHKPGGGEKHTGMVNGVSVTVIFGSNGNIATIFPSEKQPGGKKK